MINQDEWGWFRGRGSRGKYKGIVYKSGEVTDFLLILICQVIDKLLSFILLAAISILFYCFKKVTSRSETSAMKLSKTKTLNCDGLSRGVEMGEGQGHSN